MDASNWINFAILVVALVAALVAILQVVEARRARDDAKQAQTDSETARDEAREVAREATDAFTRQAVAQEKANNLAIERERVKWELSGTDGTKYFITNVGGHDALDAIVSGFGPYAGLAKPALEAGRTIHPREALVVIVERALTLPRPSVVVTWFENLDRSDPREQEIHIP